MDCKITKNISHMPITSLSFFFIFSHNYNLQVNLAKFLQIVIIRQL